MPPDGVPCWRARQFSSESERILFAKRGVTAQLDAMIPLQLRRLYFASLAVSFALPAFADTVKVPADAPVYSLDLPDGWKHEVDKDGDLICTPGDTASGPYELRVIAMPAVHSKDDMKSRLSPLAKSMGEATKQTEFEVGDLEDTKNENGVEFTGLRADGKTPEGEDKVTVMHAFEPQKEKWYVILTVGTEKADTAHDDEYSAIYDSIQPIK